MKRLHLSIREVLCQHLPFDIAEEISNDVLEFGFRGLKALEFDIFDHVADFLPQHNAEAIAEQVIRSYESESLPLRQIPAQVS